MGENPSPCVFFKSKMGCRDPKCGFAHVVRTGPSVRPCKSERDAHKQALKEALNVEARRSFEA